MQHAIMFTFTGSFQPESFGAFVRHRAGRLALSAMIRESGPTRIEVEVTGEPDLLDAFEMACSLGPADALVRDVTARALIVPGGASP